MEGGLGVDGGTAEARRAYFFYPPGEPVSALHSELEALLYVNFGGDIGL
jgi:hypothetical protein